jgi:hypothetical protein
MYRQSFIEASCVKSVGPGERSLGLFFAQRRCVALLAEINPSDGVNLQSLWN